jgi:hypothetical protein
MEHPALNGVPTSNEPTFGPLVEACASHGIKRTKAFDLAATGLLETFTIGTRRFVILQSLRTLPERMKKAAA